jgi:TonB family protein
MRMLAMFAVLVVLAGCSAPPRDDQPLKISDPAIETGPTRIAWDDPVWPEQATKTMAEFTVVLAITISKAGTVSEVKVVSAPDPEIAQAAVDAVKEWLYKPALRKDGTPVAVVQTLSLTRVHTPRPTISGGLAAGARTR